MELEACQQLRKLSSPPICYSVQTIIELQFVLSTKRTGCMQRLNPQKLNYEYLYCQYGEAARPLQKH